MTPSRSPSWYDILSYMPIAAGFVQKYLLGPQTISLPTTFPEIGAPKSSVGDRKYGSVPFDRSLTKIQYSTVLSDALLRGIIFP